jgi:hypothetical protein
MAVDEPTQDEEKSAVELKEETRAGEWQNVGAEAPMTCMACPLIFDDTSDMQQGRSGL